MDSALVLCLSFFIWFYISVYVVIYFLVSSFRPLFVSLVLYVLRMGLFLDLFRYLVISGYFVSLSLFN